MKKFKDDKGYIFLVIAVIMIFIGIFFLGFSITHSELSFGWSNVITYSIYGVYTVTIFVLLFVWAIKRWR